MNQDNQVGWDVEGVVEQMVKDSYAEGIRRAIDTVCDVDTDCEFRDRAVFNIYKRMFYEALIKLEEEVKK